MINALFSIHKQYSDLIFNGDKILEFRNKKTKLSKDSKVYVYGTKSSGCGKVVGYFVVKDIIELQHNKVGTYNMLPFYVNNYGSEDEKNAVLSMMEVHFNSHDDSLALSYLFNDDIIELCKHTHEPVDSWQMWTSRSYKIREANQKKGEALINKCDNWLKKIGYYNEYDESNWKYAIEISEAILFSNPLDIKEFSLLNGKQLDKAPQSYCYVKELGKK